MEHKTLVGKTLQFHIAMHLYNNIHTYRLTSGSVEISDSFESTVQLVSDYWFNQFTEL